MDKISQLSSRIKKYQNQARPTQATRKINVDKIAKTLIEMEQEKFQKVEGLLGKKLYPELTISIEVNNESVEEANEREKKRNKEVIAHFKKYNINI